MKFAIKNRFTDNIQFQAEIECSLDDSLSIKMGLAVNWAFNNNADLRGADLRGAYLRGAYLRGAYLRDANFTGAYLRDANFTGADLRGAYLRDANFTGADLRGAYLRDANFIGADLRGAYLRDANFTGAKFTGADLRVFKSDIWMTLAQNISEINGLINALKNGKIDGSVYEGECACLVGTIAKEKSISYKKLEHDSNNPAERWFMMIKKGDKAGDNSGGGFAAQKALEWAIEFQTLVTQVKGDMRDG